MKTTLLLPILLVGLSGSAVAQLQPGVEAPEISAKHWFNDPSATSLADLRGKTVLIEYWATW